MKVVLYLSLNKSREVAIGEALAKGFRRHGEEVEILPTEGYDRPQRDSQVAVVIGVKGKRIFEDHRRRARHTLLVDKGYFQRKNYLRLSFDGFQPHYAHDVSRPTDRFDRLGIPLRDLQPRGRHLIYAGSSQKYCNWHDLGDVTEFATGVCGKLDKLTHGSMPIYYRPKPSWAAAYVEDCKPIPGTIFSGPKEFLTDRLPGCHALVTHGSNAAIEAIAAGVPVVLVSREGACGAWSLAETNVENIAAPFWPDPDLRRQMFADLAYCQFTIDEMASGLAWETLLPHTVKGLPDMSGLNESEQLIELYKLMHRNHKMFRGNSLKAHTEAIAQLVEKHQAQSLLDFGSGKALQYDELHLHDRWGGLKPTCYDPGVEALSKKPEGQFDGVINTDVAEHIPESAVDSFLAEVIGHARKFAFFCIFTGRSRKFLPDGRNCHVTVRPPEWWLERICAATSGQLADGFMVAKVVGKGHQDFSHHVIRAASGTEVVVTFRGGED